MAKKKTAPLEANTPNGANVRVLIHHGFLNSLPLTTAELEKWAEVLPEIPTPHGRFQMDALQRIQQSCYALLTWLPVEPTPNWARAGAWWCTSKSPNYTPLKGQPVRELDPDFTADGETPLLAVLELIDKQFKGGVWHWLNNGGPEIKPASIQARPVAAAVPFALVAPPDDFVGNE